MQIVQFGSGNVPGQHRITSQSDRLFEQFIVWCDLNSEQEAVDKVLGELGISFSSLYGNQSVEEREVALEDWRERKTTAFVSKPIMYGSGVNLQQCHTAIFLGIGFKFANFLQAIKRIHRFLQAHAVEIHIIYTESEREVRRVLQEKWDKHNELTAQMSAIIREYGLARNALNIELARSFDVRVEQFSSDSYRLICGDTVNETPHIASDSVGLVLTSIPFSTQYQYTPSYRDFGHSDSNEHFFAQMDFLTPELFRVLKPGRVAAIHVKDRVVPGGMTGLGFQTVYPFHGKCIDHYIRHGFAYLGMKTIVTDVVRENNQTYRLGWTEQCKDGSRMGVGMPEYLLLFRKPPTDSSNGYADDPVWKEKADYSRSRWQIDAHGFARSSGNRLLSWDDLIGLTHRQIFQLFKKYSLEQVYDFENHVELGESLEARKILPVTFMLLQPQSWHPDVWTDITRMLSLNTAQSASGREMHLCPMQFDLADRAIRQFSMKGEIVFDPFSGLGTVPYRAVLLGRYGLGIELSHAYYQDAIYYCQAAEQDRTTPTLFDLNEDSLLIGGNQNENGNGCLDGC